MISPGSLPNGSFPITGHNNPTHTSIIPIIIKFLPINISRKKALSTTKDTKSTKKKNSVNSVSLCEVDFYVFFFIIIFFKQVVLRALRVLCG